MTERWQKTVSAIAILLSVFWGGLAPESRGQNRSSEDFKRSDGAQTIEDLDQTGDEEVPTRDLAAFAEAWGLDPADLILELPVEPGDVAMSSDGLDDVELDDGATADGDSTIVPANDGVAAAAGWLGPDSKGDMSFEGDVRTGSSTSFDGAAETIRIEAQGATYVMGVYNRPDASPFFIGKNSDLPLLVVEHDGDVRVHRLLKPGVGILFPDGSVQATAQTIGPRGPSGEDGMDGVPCWDLNDDGRKDPAEDTNRDGTVDVKDCRGQKGDTGEPGKPGPPVHTSAGCSETSTTCAGLCTGPTVMALRSPCRVTSDTGSCATVPTRRSGGIMPSDGGVCCVCAP